MEQVKEYEYVDLGLPSGLKWAKCNVGAETETDYGDYFMWGSTTPNTADECTWVNYKHCNGTEDTLTKYNTKIKYGKNPDNIITLDSVDDAARANMGGDWRMPTSDELRELLDNTTNEWATINGVSGRKFTSKTDTSKYIFFPAAGNCGNGLVYDGGNYGFIRTSSLDTSNPRNAWYLLFGLYYCNIGSSFRYYGRSVRGVMS